MCNHPPFGFCSSWLSGDVCPLPPASQSYFVFSPWLCNCRTSEAHRNETHEVEAVELTTWRDRVRSRSPAILWCIQRGCSVCLLGWVLWTFLALFSLFEIVELVAPGPKKTRAHSSSCSLRLPALFRVSFSCPLLPPSPPAKLCRRRAGLSTSAARREGRSSLPEIPPDRRSSRRNPHRHSPLRAPAPAPPPP